MMKLKRKMYFCKQIKFGVSTLSNVAAYNPDCKITVDCTVDHKGKDFIRDQGKYFIFDSFHNILVINQTKAVAFLHAKENGVEAQEITNHSVFRDIMHGNVDYQDDVKTTSNTTDFFVIDFFDEDED